MKKTTIRLFYFNGFLFVASLLVCSSLARGISSVPANAKSVPNLVYKTVGGQRLQLDLYLPNGNSEPVPLVIYIHGGGWEKGSRHQCPAFGMVAKGFAVASIDYRLSQIALFPAQIIDCKAAVRWLRANAAKYGLDPNRFGVWGTSAGGQLAALLGTSGGVKDLEGDGENLEYSSRVQAVCAVAAPTDFRQFGVARGGSGGSSARPQIGRRAQEALDGLFGSGDNRGALVVKASPIQYVSADDPPFLILHGEFDRIVPLDQSNRFYERLRDAGVKAKLKIMPNQGHQGALLAAVNDAEAFFETTLK
ncbi:MAG: alpha/beta hydrolase [Spartobacteria bacterium]